MEVKKSEKEGDLEASLFRNWSDKALLCTDKAILSRHLGLIIPNCFKPFWCLNYKIMLKLQNLANLSKYVRFGSNSNEKVKSYKKMFRCLTVNHKHPTADIDIWNLAYISFVISSLRSNLQSLFPQWGTALWRDNNHLMEVMDQNLIDDHFSKGEVNGDAPLRKSYNEEENSNKCNQCNYVSSCAGDLRGHLKTHSGEKSHKCNQCNFASSRADTLMTHLKTHSGKKSNKCNQCDFASSEASNLRRHLKTHNGQKSNKCNQCGYASS